jgi:hypothetical protein
VREVQAVKTRQVEPIECEECKGQGSFAPSAHQQTLGIFSHTECEHCGMDGAPAGKAWPRCDGETSEPHPVYKKLRRKCGNVVDGESCDDCLAFDSRVLCPACAKDPSNHVCDINPEMRGQP